MQIEKELISLYPHSFYRIEYYLSHLKEIQLKLGECGKDFPKKDGQHNELVLINFRTTSHICFIPHSVSIGHHRNQMVRTINLIHSMI